MPITASSQLMKNHVAGKPLAAQRDIAVAYGTDRTPMVFSMDEGNSLRLTVTAQTSPDTSDWSPTGWVQVDLGQQLAGSFGGQVPAVQSFAMSQDADGSIWLVVAAASNPSNPSTVFLSGKLPNDPLASAWRSITLIPRPLPPDAVVTALEIGTADDTGRPPLVVAAALGTNGMMSHYEINPDPTSDWSWYPLPLPQNATACRGVAIGTNAKLGRGVYTLSQLETLRNVTFTSFPTDFGGHMVVQTIEVAMADGFQPSAIASVAVEEGNTELYVAGNGLYRYPVSAQAASNAAGQQVADDALFNGMTELLVVADPTSATISVWGQNASDLLVHTTGTVPPGGDDYVWQTPVYLAKEVTTFASYRALVAGEAAGASSAALALGKTDGSVALLVQEPVTGLWQAQTVSLQAVDAALELTTYTTRIVVTDDSNVPWAGQTVGIQPSIDCAALVNGEYYALRATAPKPVTTDATGVITVVLESPDLTAPTYQVTLNGSSTTNDPASETKQRLRGITEGSQIATAVRSDDQPLFPNGADETSCNTAAAAVGQLMQAHDSLPDAPSALKARAGRPAPGGAPAPGAAIRSSVHVRLTPGGAVLVTEAEQALRGQAGGVDLWLAAGDLLAALEDAAETVASFAIDELEDGWRFVVELGERTLAMLFEVADQALAAVNWVLQNTLGITLDDIVAWLGYVFNWADILQNHKVIAHIVDLGLDQVVTGIAELKTQTATAFATIRGSLTGGKLPVDTSTPELSEQMRKGVESGGSQDSPHANWGSQQFRDNSPQASMAPVTVDSIEGLFSSLTQSEALVIQTAIDQIQSQIIDRFDQISFAEMVELFVEIVGEAVIDTGENIIDTTLDAIGLLVPSIKALMSARWDIPVLTWLYEQVICQADGSQLSLLDLLGLLAAIPATVVAKAATGNNLFSEATAQAVLAATDWDDLLAALDPATSPAATGATLAATKGSNADEVAATLQLVAAATRATSASIFGAREFGGFADPISNRLNLAKVGADWTTYVFSCASLFVVTKDHGSGSTRETIDVFVSLLALLGPGKDSYLVWYSWKYGEKCPRENALRYADVVFGLGVAVAVAVSLGYEVSEPPPHELDPVTWKVLMAEKFIQNFMTGIYLILNFTQAEPFSSYPKVKPSGSIGRAGALAIRAGASFARSTTQLMVSVADIDD